MKKAIILKEKQLKISNKTGIRTKFETLFAQSFNLKIVFIFSSFLIFKDKTGKMLLFFFAFFFSTQCLELIIYLLGFNMNKSEFQELSSLVLNFFIFFCLPTCYVVVAKDDKKPAVDHMT